MNITRFCSCRGARTHARIPDAVSNFARPTYARATRMNPNPLPQPTNSAWDEYGNPTNRSQMAPGSGYPTFNTQSRDILGRDALLRSAIVPGGHSIDPPQTYVPALDRPVRARKRNGGRDAKVQPSKASGGIPNPTPEYLNISKASPQQLNNPQHLLVVIDLNGTLLFRPNRAHPTRFVARPHTERFLQYCIDTFTVVIWSSAKPENVRNMCEAILTPDMKKKVAAIWGRDKFGLSKADFEVRVQCYKKLTKIWEDKTIAQCHPEFFNGGLWDQTNTVLVDDSLEKGRSEPYNLIEIPEFAGNLREPGEILPQVHDYLNHLSRHSNVSACLRAFPFKAQARPQVPPSSTC